MYLLDTGYLHLCKLPEASRNKAVVYHTIFCSGLCVFSKTDTPKHVKSWSVVCPFHCWIDTFSQNLIFVLKVWERTHLKGFRFLRHLFLRWWFFLGFSCRTLKVCASVSTECHVSHMFPATYVTDPVHPTEPDLVTVKYIPL